MPQHEPADDAELSIRLDTIKDLIVKGMSQKEIVRYCREKTDWQLSDRQYRNYVYDAKRQLAEDAPQVDRLAEFAIAVARNHLLFNSAFKLQDYKTALAANLANSKLLHLDDSRYEIDWKKAAEAAGLDPNETMRQFTEMMQAQVNKDE
jgi:hypothetical protein